MCVPISCAICTSWSPITLTVTGSTSRRAPGGPAPERRRIPSASTRSSWPGRTSVVESSSSTTAGPRSTAPAGSDSRRKTGVACRLAGEADVACARAAAAPRPAAARGRGPRARAERGHAGVDQLERLAGEAVAVHLVVQLVECRERPLQRGRVEQARATAAPRARSSGPA